MFVKPWLGSAPCAELSAIPCRSSGSMILPRCRPTTVTITVMEAVTIHTRIPKLMIMATFITMIIVMVDTITIMIMHTNTNTGAKKCLV